MDENTTALPAFAYSRVGSGLHLPKCYCLLNSIVPVPVNSFQGSAGAKLAKRHAASADLADQGSDGPCQVLGGSGRVRSEIGGGAGLGDGNAAQPHNLRLGYAAGVDEGVRGKFEAGTEFANLIQSELALTGKKHGDGTFRTELGD
jgi:hypothetical protein